MLGLNPLEQEILDLTNEIARNGFIYFPGFCAAVHKKYREEDQTLFRQNIFKVCIHPLLCPKSKGQSLDSLHFCIKAHFKKWKMLTSCCMICLMQFIRISYSISFQVLCGTKPFSDKFKAKKYKLQEQFLLKKDFVYIMKNLPEEVGRG